MESKEYNIGLLIYKAIAWVCIIFFLFCAVMSWNAGQGNVSPFFLIFVGMGILMLLIASTITINHESIIVHAPFAEYLINWSEIEKLEVGANGGLVFCGEHKKRLVLPDPRFWSGSEKKLGYDFMLNQVDVHSIAVAESILADYKTHKNVKVKT